MNIIFSFITIAMENNKRFTLKDGTTIARLDAIVPLKDDRLYGYYIFNRD